jgi:hypothetical protein
MPLTFSAAGHAGGEGDGAAVFVSRFTTFTYSGILLGRPSSARPPSWSAWRGRSPC